MPLRCGTDIEYADFSGPEGTIFIPGIPSFERNADISVPIAATFADLVSLLQNRTAQEVIEILSSDTAEDLYGPASGVIFDIAGALEGENPSSAFALHKQNWQLYRHRESLVRLPTLGFRLGKTGDAVQYLRTARFLGEPIDVIGLFKNLPFPESIPMVESVLSEVISSDPNDIPWPSREAIESIIQKIGVSQSPFPAYREEISSYLEKLEFQALTLLDRVSFAEYVQALCAIAS